MWDKRVWGNGNGIGVRVEGYFSIRGGKLKFSYEEWLKGKWKFYLGRE